MDHTRVSQDTVQICNQICYDVVKLLTTKIVAFYHIRTFILLTECYLLTLISSLFSIRLTFDCEIEDGDEVETCSSIKGI